MHVADDAELARQVEGQTVTRWLRRNVVESPDASALRRMRPDGSDMRPRIPAICRICAMLPFAPLVAIM